MECPRCGCNKSNIINVIDKKDFINRRRECKKCKFRYSTKEMSSNEWNYRVLYNELVNKISKIITKERNRSRR